MYAVYKELYLLHDAFQTMNVMLVTQLCHNYIMSKQVSYRGLDKITICCETEKQLTNIVKHSRLAGVLTSPTITPKGKTLDDDVSVIEAEKSETTSAAMMLFSNGYVVLMDTSNMMDNTLQVTIQP